MALNFKEKRQHQKSAQAALNGLAEGGIGFKKKRELQKQLMTALEALGVLVKKQEPDSGGTSLLAQLVAGDFNNLGVKAFRDKMAEAFSSSGDQPDALDMLKTAGFSYLKVNKAKLAGGETPVFESLKKNS